MSYALEQPEMLRIYDYSCDPHYPFSDRQADPNEIFGLHSIAWHGTTTVCAHCITQHIPAFMEKSYCITFYLRMRALKNVILKKNYTKLELWAIIWPKKGDFITYSFDVDVLYFSVCYNLGHMYCFWAVSLSFPSVTLYELLVLLFRP